MTYIELINRFWDLDTECSFSGAQTKLYFAILNYANRLNWKEPLSIPNTRLLATLGISKSALGKARQRLIDTGLIKYKHRTTRLAGLYWYSDWYSEKANDATNKRTMTTPIGEQSSYQSENNNATLYKTRQDIDKDKIKKKHTKKVDEIISLYHETCVDLPKVKLSSKTRNALIKARWKEHPDLQFFKDFFEKVKSSDFLSGKITSFRADLEWLMRPSNFVKVVEGKYDNREAKNGKLVSGNTKHDEWLEKFKNPAGHTITDEDVEAIILRPNKARSA